MAQNHEGNTGDRMRLSPREAALLGGQIAGLTSSSLPLPAGLRALTEELPRGRLRSVAGALARALEQGATLDAAIAAQGRALPPHLRGLVQAGVRTGRTGEILGRCAAYAQVGVDVRRRLWLSLAYPIIAVVFAGGLLLFILTYLIGGFEQIFRDFGLRLSTLSVFLIELSGLLRRSGLVLAEGLGLLIAIGLVVLVILGPAAGRSAVNRLPLVGMVWRWTALAEFCHLLGLLLESELPLVEAVPMAGAGVGDGDIQAAARLMAVDLARGESFAEAIRRRPLFPEGLGQILAWAEQHQSLTEALHMLGSMFEGRARAQASFASTVCMVLAVVGIVAAILAFIFGAIAPMMQLLSKLSG
jgi:general secretion pathway protein F